MNRIEYLTIGIVSLICLGMLGILFLPEVKNNDVCINNKLYIKKGEILYPKYGWSKQLTCLNAKGE